MNESDEEREYVTASQRHYEIVNEGELFFRRLAWGCLALVVLSVSFVIFLMVNYDKLGALHE